MPCLIDTHSRKIDYMRISITDRCNLRCRYCMPELGVKRLKREGILSYEEILKLVDIATRCNIQKIRITGGEPLTRKGIIGFLKQLTANPSIKETTITTNGTLLPTFAKSLKEAGIKRVNISLDTLKPERYSHITRKDHLRDVLDGIMAAQVAGLTPIKINCVALKGFNDDEILDFAALTLSHPYHIRFIEFMPVGKNDYWSPDRILYLQEIMGIIQGKYTLEAIKPENDLRDTATHYKITGGIGEIGFISPISQCFCKACNRLRLTPDGRLRNCLFSDQEFDIKRPLRGGASDSEIEAILKESIKLKPSGHELKEDFSFKCKRSMWQIGG